MLTSCFVAPPTPAQPAGTVRFTFRVANDNAVDGSNPKPAKPPLMFSEPLSFCNHGVVETQFAAP
jgi:hypothetical protein